MKVLLIISLHGSWSHCETSSPGQLEGSSPCLGRWSDDDDHSEETHSGTCSWTCSEIYFASLYACSFPRFPCQGLGNLIYCGFSFGLHEETWNESGTETWNGNGIGSHVNGCDSAHENSFCSCHGNETLIES